MDNLSGKPNSLYSNSRTALAYYSGVLLALDTLQSLGLNIHLKVLDVPNDSVFNIILDSTILDDRALIIGPLLANQFRQLSEKYGSDINRRLVSPLSYKNVIGNTLILISLFLFRPCKLIQLLVTLTSIKTIPTW